MDANDTKDLKAVLEEARRNLRQRSAVDGGGDGSLQVQEDLLSLRKSAGPPSASNSGALNARDNRGAFVEYYYRLIQKFVEDRSKLTLEVPNLSAYDRKVVHDIATLCNLSHVSSGQGDKRMLRLSKDELFYQKPPNFEKIDLDAIMERNGAKRSKFDLRHFSRGDAAQREAGEVGSYAEADAVTGMARLHRQTDEYRHAKRQGYTTEELVEGQEQPRKLEDVLRAAAPAPAAPAMLSLAGPTGGDVSGRAEGQSQAAVAPASTTKAHTGPKSFVEVCRGCLSRVPLDYPAEKWTCSKHCGVCARTTIWALEETEAPATDAGQKRRREEPQEGTAGVPEVQEIDYEEEEPLTVEDISDMMALNDFNSEDVNYMRTFATRCGEHVNQHLVFCSDFGDLQHVRAFAANDNENAPPPTYVVLRASDALHRTVTSLLAELLQRALVQSCGGEEEDTPASKRHKSETAQAPQEQLEIEREVQERDAWQYVRIACANASVYGVEATLLVRLQPFKDKKESTTTLVCVVEEAIAEMMKQYGSRHCHQCTSLAEAVEHATASSSSF